MASKQEHGLRILACVLTLLPIMLGPSKIQAREFTQGYSKASAAEAVSFISWAATAIRHFSNVSV